MEVPDGAQDILSGFNKHIPIRIGVPNEVVDAVVADHAATLWAYVTAYNPDSEALGDAGNGERHARLLTIHRMHPSPGSRAGDSRIAATGRPERSLLIIGVLREEAIDFGRRFGNNAILVGW